MRLGQPLGRLIGKQEGEDEGDELAGRLVGGDGLPAGIKDEPGDQAAAEPFHQWGGPGANPHHAIGPPQ